MRMTMEDFTKMWLQERAAYHQAGHAVVCLRLGGQFSFISIEQLAGEVDILGIWKDAGTPEQVILISLVGYLSQWAGEILTIPPHAPAGVYFQKFIEGKEKRREQECEHDTDTAITETLVASASSVASLGMDIKDLQETLDKIFSDTREKLHEYNKKSYKLFWDNRGAIYAVAKELMRRGRLSYSEVVDIVASVDKKESEKSAH